MVESQQCLPYMYLLLYCSNYNNYYYCYYCHYCIKFLPSEEGK